MSKIRREDGKSSIEEYTGAETEEGFESGSRRGRGRDSDGEDTGSYLDPNQDPSSPDDESEIKPETIPLWEYASDINNIVN